MSSDHAPGAAPPLPPTTPEELAVAVAAARRSVERCPAPGADPRTRLGTSLAVRRLVPTRLAVARAARRGAQLWEHDPQARERARGAMAAVLGGTPRAGEVEDAAREHLIEEQVKDALFWQPWRPVLSDASRERLAAAFASGRGVLLSGCHSGPYLQGVSAAAQLGRVCYSAAGPWSFATPARGSWGRRIARRRTEARARGERLVYSVGSFPVLRELLAQGEVVNVFFVMPGGRETLFLGKPVMLASGSARLAVEAGALVLPLRTRRVGHRVLLDVGEALDARDFSGVADLHEALARAHERWIFELPAALEDPRRAGAWEGATDAGWLRARPAAVG